jgi:hypothetical protein
LDRCTVNACGCGNDSECVETEAGNIGLDKSILIESGLGEETSLYLFDKEVRARVRQVHIIGSYHLTCRGADARHTSLRIAQRVPCRNVFDPGGFAECFHSFIALRGRYLDERLRRTPSEAADNHLRCPQCRRMDRLFRPRFRSRSCRAAAASSHRPASIGLASQPAVKRRFKVFDYGHRIVRDGVFWGTRKNQPRRRTSTAPRRIPFEDH